MPGQRKGRKLHAENAQHRRTAAAGLRMQAVGAEVVMKMRPHAWAILAGGIAVAAAAFFASAGITHWVMGLHSTDVVVRPGPTVYLPAPAGHGHIRHRGPSAQVPAGLAYGGGGARPQEDAHARPDHKGAHARRDHRRAHGGPDDRGRRLLEPRPGAAHHHDGRGMRHPPITVR